MYRLVLLELYTLLRNSLNWYNSMREMSGEEGSRSIVRSSDLETGLSYSDEPVGMEVGTTASYPSSSKPSSFKKKASKASWAFHSLKVSCNLDDPT